MSTGFNALPPRMQGVATLAVAAGAALVGVLVARMLETQYYPIVFPLSGFAAGLGLFQIVSGYGRDMELEADDIGAHFDQQRGDIGGRQQHAAGLAFGQ